MDIIALGSSLVKERFGIDLDSSTIGSALQSLLGGADGQIDLQGLIGNVMSSGSLSSIVGSWLGGGENSPINVDQISEIFGQEKIASFASKLNIGEATAAEGLTDIVPQLIDRFSGDGSGMDAGNALGGMMDMAKKFF